MSDTIDINVYETTEDVTINVTPNIIEVNINKITSTGAVSSVNGKTGDVVLTTSDLQNDSNFVSDVTYVHTDNNYTTTEKSKLAGIQAGAEVNVNADWNATSGDAQILNKPTIPTSLPPNGTAGGDLQGTYPNPTVHQIQGQSVQNGNPADGDILTWDNTALMWKHLQLAYAKVISALGFTPENIANKSTSVTTDSTSNIKYPSVKSVYDWAVATFTTTSAVATQITTALSGYATQAWVNSQGFITNVISALGYTPENTANKSTSTADSASTTKFPVWSAIISYFSATQIRSILGISTLSGSNTGDQDLSGLALKSMSAYSMRVNNTNATANATETNFQQIGKTAYTGTITWTGTTAPSGTTNHSYNWIRIGNLVTLTINLVYGTAGALNTAVQMALPSDAPTPIKPDGLISASNVLYEAIGKIGASESNVSTGAIEAVLRSNSANTGFELYLASVSANGKVVRITCNYFTA